ncbi:MAG: thiamine pyrophosphate-binding protein [Chloroflexi bacterium]|nr:thiamine pyrophosphate-binding protein [Chloroflexota bacterium]
MIPVESVWESLARRRGDAVVVTSMTSFRNWPEFSRDPELDFPNTVMGKGSSVGLGLALARPDRTVIVLDGDGSLLMNLGTLVTISAASPRNLIHIVFQNGIYEVTGGQPIPGVGALSFAAMARGAGWRRVFEIDALDAWELQADDILREDGPTFVVLHVTRAARVPPSPPRKTRQAFPELQARLAAEPGSRVS